MKRLCLFSAALVLVFALCACTKTTNPQATSFSAVIMKIEEGNLLVTPDTDTKEAKSFHSIRVITQDGTKYFNVDGSNISHSELAVGQRVSIVYDGKIAESDPAQIQGLEVQILSNIPKAEPAKILIKVNKEAKNYYYDSDQKTLMLVYSSQTPQVTIQGQDKLADTMNGKLNSLTKNFSGELDKYLEKARGDFDLLKAAYASMEDKYYSYERSVSVMRGDSKVLSFAYDDSRFTGNTQENTKRSGVSFVMDTGEQLTLTKLSSDADAMQKFCTNYILELSKGKAYSEGKVFKSGYEKKIAQIMADPLWYFSEKGLVFVANPDPLSGYANGSFEFTIPYADLRGIIDERWIPQTKDSSKDAQVEIAFAKSQTVLDTLTMDQNGQNFVLTAKGTLQNVRLSVVGYDDKDSSFFEKGTLWFASRLEDGEAVKVIAIIPEGPPNLQISYTASDGSVVKRLISESGKDGSLLLVNMDQ